MRLERLIAADREQRDFDAIVARAGMPEPPGDFWQTVASRAPAASRGAGARLADVLASAWTSLQERPAQVLGTSALIGWVLLSAAMAVFPSAMSLIMTVFWRGGQ